MKPNATGIAALETYRKVGIQSEVETASPHRLIQMLLDGALTRIAAARGHMQRGDLAGKGENIGWSISIISGLKGSLNLEAGGKIAGNLDRLYDYMLNCLSEANINNDVSKLDEVSELLGQISSGWQGIRDQVGKQAAPEAVSHAAS